MQPCVAITGAHGFLGSALTSALSTDHQVTSLGRHHGDQHWELSDVHAPALPSASAIIHCAWAVTPRTRSVANMNVAGSLALLDEAQRRAIPFIFISSMSASEGTRSRYGSAKRAVERHVLRYRNGVVVRPGTIQDASGGLGMLTASLSRLAALPVQARIHPEPRVPVVGLTRVVDVTIRRALTPSTDEQQMDLVDAWVPLSELVRSLATTSQPQRTVRLPSALVTAGSTLAQRASIPPFRDLGDSWLGLIDASRAQ